MLINQVKIQNFNTSAPLKRTEYLPDNSKISFGSKPEKEPVKTKFYRLSEQAMRFQEKIFRRASNSIAAMLKRPLINEYYQKFVNLDENSSEYVVCLAEIGRFWAQKKEFEVNRQDKRIDDIVNSDEACIFIMNHDHQAQDPVLLGCVANLLYSKYLEAGKGETCPRPKIIMNEDILSTQPEKMRAIFEKFGAVGVDASLFRPPDGGKRNTKQLIPMMTGFCKDANHVFIFPEGKMCAFDDLDLKQVLRN